MSEPKVYSVTQLTLSVRKNLLANNEKIAGVWIEGEISGNKIYGTGHRYFTLKDKGASISCVLFAFSLGGCDAAFKQVLAGGEDKVNGLKVQVSGELDFNMSRGQYSFKVHHLRMAKDPLGEKMAQFNELKARIEKAGRNKLDHPQLRRPLPFLPHRIGIVTSPSGAVIHDMCDTINRRFPNVEIRLYPCKVQGDGAARSVVAGIRFFNELLVNADYGWKPDVLIVARGGGSMEDLWAFNDEALVREVAASKIPIVSAVGHESDFTLCDYVADLRAGTPSIAAERVVPVKKDLVAKVENLSGRLARALRQSAETCVQHVDYLTHRLSVAPQGAINRAEKKLVNLSGRLVPSLKDSVSRFEGRLQCASLQIDPPMRRAVEHAQAGLAQAEQKLMLLNPYAILGRGYSITTDADGRVVRAVSDVQTGMRLNTRLGDGAVESVVV